MISDRIPSFIIAMEILLDYRKDWAKREEECAFRPTVLRAGRDLVKAMDRAGRDAHELRTLLNAVESPLVAEQGPSVPQRWPAVKARLEQLVESFAAPLTRKPSADQRVRKAIERFLGCVERFLAHREEIVRRENLENCFAEPTTETLMASLKRGQATMRAALLVAGGELVTALQKSGRDAAPLQAFLKVIEADRPTHFAILWPPLKSTLEQIQ